MRINLKLFVFTNLYIYISKVYFKCKVYFMHNKLLRQAQSFSNLTRNRWRGAEVTTTNVTKGEGGLKIIKIELYVMVERLLNILDSSF